MSIGDVGAWLVDRVDIPGWLVIDEAEDGFMYQSRDGLRVISSGQMEQGKRWMHVSYSRRDRLPDYIDTVEVKKLFIGDDRKAIMVFPEKKFYVNFHANCLHLWSCLDGDGLPEFSHGLGTI